MQALRIFCDVGRHRSLSRAAAEHGITQSAVSQRIQQLEKKLGVALLDRSVRPLALTEAGQQFLDGCRDLLVRYDRLERNISRLNQLEGQVRVGAIYSAGIDLLNVVSHEFVGQNPSVSVKVDYKRPNAVHDEVCQGQSDIGIVSHPSSWRDVSAISLRDEIMDVVCRADHPLAQQPLVAAAQLADWPMVGFEQELPVARQIRRYLKEHGAAPRVTHAFDNIDTIKTALMETDDAGKAESFSILPRRTVQREVAAKTLSAITLGPTLLRPMGIIYAKRGRTFTPAVQAFVDFLLEHAGPKVDGVETSPRNDASMVGDRV